jgi:hypothetical protein
MQTASQVVVVKKPAQITRFVQLVQAGIQSWEKAGKILVQELEKDPNFKQAVKDASPEISSDLLDTFERIGRKQIYAPLLADSSPASRALLELPYEMQERYFNEPIPVLVGLSKGKQTVQNKKLGDLSRAEVRQVFSKGCIRTPEEQTWTFPEPKKPVKAATQILEKPVQVGYFKLDCDGKGNVTVTPTTHDPRAQYVRIIPKGGVGSDFHTTVLLFYRAK